MTHLTRSNSELQDFLAEVLARTGHTFACLCALWLILTPVPPTSAMSCLQDPGDADFLQAIAENEKVLVQQAHKISLCESRLQQLTGEDADELRARRQAGSTTAQLMTAADQVPNPDPRLAELEAMAAAAATAAAAAAELTEQAEPELGEGGDPLGVMFPRSPSPLAVSLLGAGAVDLSVGTLEGISTANSVVTSPTGAGVEPLPAVQATTSGGGGMYL